MTWVDYAIIAVIGISVAVSLMRGFVREALSLATWVFALWVALMYFEPFADYFAPWVGVRSARLTIAFVVLFVVVLIVGGILNSIVAKLVKKTGLTGTDRIIGVLFGFARGVVVIGLLVLSAGLTALPQDQWWAEAHLLNHFQSLALWMRDFLPAELADNIHYDYYD